MADRVLTVRALNRAVLARQGLLERSARPVPRVLESMAGLQAQYAPSMYIGLWSRVEGLERDALTRMLEQRRVVQATLMRATIHLVSRADFWPLALATRGPRRRLHLAADRDGLGEDDFRRAADRLRGALASGPLRRTEIEALLGKPLARGVGQWLELVRVPPSGTWERRRADLFGLAEDWLGPPGLGEADARARLVRRYLGGFGPASRGDIASFTGLSAAELAPVLEALAPRTFRSEAGDELLDLPRAPLPDPDTPAPVRFLPTWDASLLVHARRARILPEEHRPRIFNTKMPQSVGTVLVEGAVAATWRLEGDRVAVEPLDRLDASVRREIDAEGERLAAFCA